MLEFLHRNPLPGESNPFAFEPEALLEGIFPSRRDPAPGAYNPMPGQTDRAAQRPHCQTRAPWDASRLGHRSIGGYFPPRDLPDRGADR
ncbi:MAG TPA: hypothetical protein VGL53_06185 [Bryobacteraceae bacterium]